MRSLTKVQRGFLGRVNNMSEAQLDELDQPPSAVKRTPINWRELPYFIGLGIIGVVAVFLLFRAAGF